MHGTQQQWPCLGLEAVRLFRIGLSGFCFDLFSLIKYYLFYQSYTIHAVSRTGSKLVGRIPLPPIIFTMMKTLP